MTIEEKRQKASVIVIKILRLLENEKLTVNDAKIILRQTQHQVEESPIPVTTPADVEWQGVFGTPSFLGTSST